MTPMYELDAADVDTIKESLRYSIQRIEATPDTPREVKRENVARLERVLSKLPHIVARIRERGE